VKTPTTNKQAGAHLMRYTHKTLVTALKNEHTHTHFWRLLESETDEF